MSILDFFKEEEYVPEEEPEYGRPAQPLPPKEEEQIPVWVKLVDVSDEMKQGYRQVCVFMNEPPPVSFGYCFSVMGWWILASFCWTLILGIPTVILLGVLGVIR